MYARYFGSDGMWANPKSLQGLKAMIEDWAINEQGIAGVCHPKWTNDREGHLGLRSQQYFRPEAN